MKRLGLSKTTILRWEKEGKIPPGRRDELGWRWWTEEEFEGIAKLTSSDFSREFLPKLSKKPSIKETPRFTFPALPALSADRPAGRPSFRTFLAPALLAVLVFSAVAADFVSYFENASFVASERLQYSALYLRNLVPAKPSVQFSFRLPDDYFLAMGQDLKSSLPEIGAGLQDGIFELRRLVANVEPPRFDIRILRPRKFSLSPGYFSQSGALLANLTGEAENFFYRVGQTLNRIFDENKQFVYSLFAPASPEGGPPNLTSDVGGETPGVAPVLSSETQFLRFEIDSLRKELEALRAAGVRLEGEKVVERIFERTLAELPSGDLDAKLASLNQALREEILTVRRALDEKTQANFNALALTQRINTLGPVSISSPTISTPTITGQVDSLTVRTLTITGSCSGCGGGSSNTSGWTDDGTIVRLTDIGDLVGIGTSSPYAKLSVVGEVVAASFTATSTTATSTFSWGIQTPALNVTSTSATSTFSNGLRLSGGCFELSNGTCAGSGASIGGAISGGTSGSVLFVDASANLAQDNANLFWDDTGNILRVLNASSTNASVIGTLTIGGTATTTLSGNTATSTFAAGLALTGTLDVNSSTATSTFANGLRVEGGCVTVAGACLTNLGQSIDLASEVSGVLPIANGGTNNSSAYTSGSVIFSNGTSLTQDNSNFFFDDANNRLGIGTTSPWGILSVESSAAAGATNPIFVVSDQGTSTPFLIVEGNRGFVGIGTTTPQAQLGLSTFSGFPSFMVGSSTTQFLIDKNGNVGIGTTGPGAALDTKITSTAGQGTLIAQFGSQTSARIRLYDETSTLGPAIDFNAGNVGRITGAGNIAIMPTNNGNVGIGTTSPGQLLSVAGDILGNNIIGSYFTATSTTATSTFAAGLALTGTLDVNSTSATSTFANGIRIEGGGLTASTLTSCTALETDANGNVLCGSDATGSGVGIGDTVTSGTTGSILFVGSGPVLAQDNANLFWDDTNNRLGIGTTSPWAKLSVNNYSSGASSVPLFTVASSTGTGATSTAFIINSVGNIGIGTTSPNALLHLFSTVASNNNPQLILQNYAAGGY